MIVRSAITELLRKHGITVTQSCQNEAALAEALSAVEQPPCQVIVLILMGNGPFRRFHQIRETLNKTRRHIPLLVLSEPAGRGQVYSAVRIGAKAYIDLDAETEELIKAIHLAAADRAYLSPDAAELLVKDISEAAKPEGRPGRARTGLSPREVEVVQLLCEGLSSKEIARRLHLSPKTVENHRYNIYKKCRVDNIAALMRHAIRQGLVTV